MLFMPISKVKKRSNLTGYAFYNDLRWLKEEKEKRGMKCYSSFERKREREKQLKNSSKIVKIY